MPSDIPTQPRHPWPSVKEDSILHFLDKKTRDYRKNAELTKIQDIDNNKKKKKFGNFMGKLLLQSSNSVSKSIPKVTKEKTLKQQVLTEEPFACLFRVRKNRNDQHQEVGESIDEIKICLKSACQSPEQQKVQLSNDTNGKSDQPNCRLVQGRRTRWDIHNNTEVKISNPCADSLPSNIEHKVLFKNDDVDMDKSDDDNHSFSESLQSDDDVLGPWIELGLMDPKDNSITTMDSVKNQDYHDCQECIKINENRQPLELGSSCTKCILQWDYLIQKMVTAISEASTASSKKKYKRQNKTPSNCSDTEQESTNDVVSVQANIGSTKKLSAIKKSSDKYNKPVIPPTKSRHSQKTNYKIMASKKNENTTIIESPKKKIDNGPAKVSHFTTGAFMTRKTVRTLADPEHGFYPNTHGFVYGQNVDVLNINGYWYPGTLQMMDKGKVKVKYDDWDDQEEWIIMGSRRLRTSLEPRDSTLESQNQKRDVAIASEVIDVMDFEDGDGEISWTDTNKSQSPPKDVEIMPSNSNIHIIGSKADDDYVSSTLDKDPSQIFNNNEVFMTRSMARGLVDEHGFKPNSFGYRRNRAVSITFYSKQNGSRKTKQESVGYLREMHQDQVRVWYPELHQSEWIPVGSRRLRVMTEEEEKNILSNNSIDFNVQEVPPTVNKLKGKEKEDAANSVAPDKNGKIQPAHIPEKTTRNVTMSNTAQNNTKKGAKAKQKKASQDKEVCTTHKNTSHTSIHTTVDNSERENTDTIIAKLSKEAAPSEDMSANNEFLTTGAFATRRAMRQLKDKNGFTPNPYGYTNGLAVEILNTRSGKTKFWECGKLVAMRPGHVRVHYEGWADIYDEWIMVGSRRIRVSNNVESEESSKTCALDVKKAVKSNDLLITETNPELMDESRRNHKHQIVRPQDYQNLGMLVNVEELTVKQTQKKDRHNKKKPQDEIDDLAPAEIIDTSATLSEDEETEYSPDLKNHGPKKTRKKTKQLSTKKNHQLVTNNCATPHANNTSQSVNKENSANDKQIISLRLAQAEASKNYKFVANVYGYDYMQHVTVLHLDKKLYEGRLVSMHKNKVKIHYCGWLDSFDEYVTLGSRRLQAIENDHEVQCIEPNYQQRCEQMLTDKVHMISEDTTPGLENIATTSNQPLINRFSRKRLTLDDIDSEAEFREKDIEYHKDQTDNNAETTETDTWKVYCNQCSIVIKQFRYYCTYCETPSGGHDYRSFELCLRCFDQNFPFWHEHPRSSFAIQAVIDTEIGPRPIKGELVTVWEEDILELAPNKDDTTLCITNESSTRNLSILAGVTDVDQPDNTGIINAIESNDIHTNKSKIAQIEEIETPNNQTITGNDIEDGAVDASKVFTGNVSFDTDQGYKYLKRWKRRKLCAFCNDDDDTSTELGNFIGPFVIATFNKNGVEKKRSFWAHDSCARYSPEVFCTPEGKWYNVTLALRRGRGMRCHGCKEKGATIGCFESKCNKSFHLPCSQKPVSYFKNGVIFWCGIHEAYYNKKDTYVNVFNCDGCSKKLVDESWFTCVPCASSYFSSFDLCSECYEKFPADHDHNEDEFEETSFAILKEMEAQKATEAARAKEDIRAANAKKKKKPLFPRRRRKLADGSTPVSCCYCGTYDADTWRKGYDGGVIMCNPCFELALLIDNDGRPGEENMPLVIDNTTIEFDKQQNQQHKYVASIEDYSHKPYLTRDTLSATKFSDSSTGQRLASYEPQPNQLFSLTFDSTYFDIPGRAPRWATHSGTDYHGTWLPQTVRRAILKYTTKDERVLSNFLGRGTDAIECFLLQRRCCGVDINPAAVALSQRNCCFEIPPGLTSAEYRPIVAQADSRNLSGSLFVDESYHHILSHPPYKDCVAYSTHLDGDLSRFTSVEDFKIEYTKVVKESWRLLKMDRRLTLGIGDNREHCFYIPVGFHLIRLYIDHGFELEELVIKRQRYCSAFGLGTYLCVQFDFLVFTHEFIATFKKVPKENNDRMAILKDNESDVLEIDRTMYGVPSSAIMRKSVVMGTVWVFKPTEEHRFEKLCISRMVERFGKDDGNWEHIELVLEAPHNPYAKKQVSCVIPAEKEETPIIGDDNPLSEYEQQRLSRIEENNKTLLKLGLISELSEESDDVIHYETMMKKAVYEDGDLVLMITSHRSDLLPDKINSYRQTIVKLAKEATSKLAPKGMFIVGTQDIRDSYTGKLWPMTMLILEDIENEVGRDTIKLKEMVVTVPDGYSKDRKRDFVEVEVEQEEEEEDVIDIETVNHDYVPIVHAVYLIFQKF